MVLIFVDMANVVILVCVVMIGASNVVVGDVDLSSLVDVNVVVEEAGMVCNAVKGSCV